MNCLEQDRNFKKTYQLIAEKGSVYYRMNCLGHFNTNKSVAKASLINKIAGMPYTITAKSNNSIWVEVSI
jgi:hypothetical protein